jgi:hypothetical protein
MTVAGCAARGPSKLYPTPPPPIDPPALQELPTIEGCPATEAMNEGDPSPYVDDHGYAKCAALVVPPATYQRFLREASELLPYYRERLTIERDGRMDDRARAEWYVGQLEDEGRALRRENLGFRVAVPVVATVAVVVGIALGLAADDLAEVVP